MTRAYLQDTTNYLGSANIGPWTLFIEICELRVIHILIKGKNKEK